ncbi:MAG: hypothetical protein ISS88_00455 [Candidatus Portnoybacteria bacterium]|nr:hypothetical protein [Candidatus Portnoybacteria bacterium]
MTNETQKLIGIKDLFRNSWNIYKKDFKKFLVIAVIFFGVMGLMMTFIGPEIPQIPEAKKAQPFFTIPWYLFLPIILATSLISILGTASLISAVKEVPQEWKIRDVLKKGWSKYLSFLLVALLTGLVVGLGFLLLIIPGVIFAIWFVFSTYTVICEDKKGFKALSRSKELVKGCWWPTAKRVFALIIITIPLSMGAQFIPYLGQFAYVILFTPFSIIYNYLIYQNLKEIKG